MLNHRTTTDVDDVSRHFGLATLLFAAAVSFRSDWMLKQFLSSSPNPEHAYALVVGLWILVSALLNIFSGFTAAAKRQPLVFRELVLLFELACLVLAVLMISEPDSLTFLGESSCGLGLGTILLVNALGCRYGSRR
jgi:hypothetical protein